MTNTDENLRSTEENLRHHRERILDAADDDVVDDEIVERLLAGQREIVSLYEASDEKYTKNDHLFSESMIYGS